MPIVRSVPSHPGLLGQVHPTKEAVSTTAQGSVSTVIYVHGIGNKPTASVLKCQWDCALFGHAMGDRTRIAYWVNRRYYPLPLNDTCAGADIVEIESPAMGSMGVSREELEQASVDHEEISRLIVPEATGRHQSVLQAIAERMDCGHTIESQQFESSPEIIPLPGSVRRWIARQFTRLLLRDVNDFLFHEDRRAVMVEPLRERLSTLNGPVVVVAHSQGSMIAYHVLRTLEATLEVPLLVTIGSPLGIQEVQDELARIHGSPLRPPRCVRSWVNVADRLDPVAIDPRLANDFDAAGVLTDILERNPDSPSHPHSGTGYLSTPSVRRAVVEAVGPSFAQQLASFSIALDLAERLEDAKQAEAGNSRERFEVLVQLSVEQGIASLDEARERVVGEITQIAGAQVADAKIDPLRSYVAANLTRFETETLAARLRGMRFTRIWQNSVKRTLLNETQHTIQALPARRAYGADGAGIQWAVLDSGVCADHPHFLGNKTIVEQWDCTGTGAIQGGHAPDGHGHGTHVAAIIAGQSPKDLIDSRGRPVELCGIAPQAKLHIYKVLSDDGSGRDSAIIKALDHIRLVNEQAGCLFIHGVNLSLGGPFDRRVYGCGHSPLCQELRRLWQEGVVVCIAAGNEGFAVVATRSGDLDASFDLSISDPANLEEAITVGAVQKEKPHTYGVSYFSSRGPTADGRFKPDVVAPGERILSAFHRLPATTSNKVDDYYVSMSGTSMAAPHVSGAIAGFLSIRREFIGLPDRVKQILGRTCTDLGRDRYLQGNGLINVMQMLATT